MSKLTTLVALTVTLFVVACDPRGLPAVKRLAKEEDDRITKQTEEAIQKSPALQEIHRLCMNEIPKPQDFVPVNKYWDVNEEKFIGYGYFSSNNFESVKSFYASHLTTQGWQLAREKDRSWGQPEIEFRKDNYRVTLIHVGGERISYVVSCGKL